MLIMMFWLTMLVTMKLEHAPMFPLLSHNTARINCELHFLPRTSPAVFMNNGWMNGRVQCRGQACRLHAECFTKIPQSIRGLSINTAREHRLKDSPRFSGGCKPFCECNISHSLFGFTVKMTRVRTTRRTGNSNRCP